MLHKQLNLSNEILIDMYKTMLLTRKIDERNWLLNRAGKTPFVVSGQGQEAAQIAISFALDRSKDIVAPYYRDLGVVLAFGMTAKEIMLSYFAKKSDPNSGGRQMPHHFSSKKLRILSGSSPVATQLTHAVGVAYALKMEGRNDVVCMASLGEGSTNQMDFHDALNFASIYKLPVVFVCENNEYAISTRVDLQVACKDVADRAKGYNMPGVVVNGMNLLESYKASKEAVDFARAGNGPTLLEFKVKRFTAHSSDDNAALYMSQEEIKNLRNLDPIPEFYKYLLDAKIISEADNESFMKQIDEEVKEAINFAEAAAFAAPEEALDHVYDNNSLVKGE
ncbi:thiamine pyrophosphate-dependent dehydrogenase E1 component subunit alpha [Rickettsiales bacterium LUAb2]